jgi:hypothetical protein
MSTRKLRNRLAGAASVGIVAAMAMMVLGTSVAYAAPGDPSFETAPHFYNGNVETIRSEGSDTTFFMMQSLGDLYESAGLYGCTLNNAAAQTLFNSGDPAATSTNEEYYCQAGANIDTTDVNDNWDRTEVSVGIDDIGSGAGQEQLCGNVPSPLPVDFARSSKPIISTTSGGCSTEAEMGYAKDAVPAVDYQTVNPSTYGTSAASAYDTINGGNVGPVADGWLPGDPVGGPYNGTAFANVSNVDGGASDNSGGADSTAYRLWCAPSSATGLAAQITDWGSLTNLGPNLELVDVTTSSSVPTITLSAGAPEGTTFPSAVANGDSVSGPGIQSGTTVSGGAGTSTLTLSKQPSANSTTATLTFAIGSTLFQGQGIPDGIPTRIVGVNSASGTEATFANYAESGVSSGGCSSNLNGNAANDPNPATAPTPNSAHIALENNAAQIEEFAEGDWPADVVDQAIEVATSIYFESNGAYNTDPFAGETQLWSSGTPGTGTATIYTAEKITENGQTPTSGHILNNQYPTARTLFNIYRTDTVRASTAGFLNWICDANSDFTKGTDNRTGLNYDNEINTFITGTYGFVQLTDTSAAPAIATPADNQPAPNTTCASGTVVVGGVTEGNGIPAITSVASPNT